MASSPPSLDQLKDLAKINFNNQLPIKSYVRSCQMLFHQAHIHQATDIDLAFIYLFRAARVILQDLPTHPEYSLLPPAYRAQIEADGMKYLDAMVPIKTKLTNRYNQPAPETNIPSLTDWTIIESPPYEPIRQTSWQPSINGKPKTNQNRVSAHHHSKTSPFASSSFLSSNCKPTQRNPLVWPVELGNGQGQRMSVALNLDQPSSCSHDARLQDSQSRSYQSDLPGQHASQDTSHPRVTFRHQQTLYDLPDPANPNPSPRAQPSRPITHQPPSKPKKSPFSLGRFNISSEHLCGLNQSPTALPSSHSHTSPPVSSTFKALLRPRRLSLSSPSSKPQSRESLGSWASVSVPASPPEEQSSPPSTPQTSSRSRRGSLGEASTWRWLKGLNLKPVGNSFKSHASANLYADLPSSADLPSLAPPAPIISAASARPAPNNRSRPTPPPIPPKQFRTEKSQIIFPSSSSDASPSSRPLRPMRCPNDLVGAFVAMAEPETQKGVELCGLLLGKLREGELVVDTLLIPKQVSTADTCHTIDEESTFSYQNEHGLMTLGWPGSFHPHPAPDNLIYTSPLDAHFKLVSQDHSELVDRMHLEIIDLRTS
ncbi:hypothetical protein VP01_83g17 [Puccinia sorghi]|uniref:USP8 dimerisation domain-containing protein n=1 Tax=Puccinia sorghi TaxID=27349 RepID=A0A0L6U9G6_9BASI|nr:hypothetical protein VP01_83g17 [Puccinia sorghi]